MNMLRPIRKLRRMSWGEIAFRLRERGLRWAERLGLLGAAAPLPAADEGLVQAVAELRRLVPCPVRADFSAPDGRLRDFPEAERAATLAAADAVLRGTPTLLGRTVRLPETGSWPWHRDPLSAHVWPLRHHADLRVYELPGVDVKYVWELNRHQYLVDLSRAWSLTGDERYAARAAELLEDWISSNPYGRGVNWSSGLEVAVRGLAWIWSLSGLLDWDGWKRHDLRRVLQSLADHATFLSRHPSVYTSPYNHLIGEATALLWLARVLAAHPKAAAWERQATALLATHAPAQFHTDGMLVEQAVGYHFFTLGFLLQAHAALEPPAPLRTVLGELLRRGFAVGERFRMPDGCWPVVGDWDSARALPVVRGEERDFSGLCRVAAIRLGQGGPVPVGEVETSAELLWWHGPDGPPTPRRRGSTVRQGIGPHLPASGYALFRDDERQDWLLVDGGPVAGGLFADATPSVAHGHADTMQVLYCHGGEPLLVDSGMPSYAGESREVDYFRSPQAHNTFAVDDLPLVRPAGRLAWSHVLPPPLMQVGDDPRTWFVELLQNLPGGGLARRTVLRTAPFGVWIVDRVSLPEPRAATWWWNLAGQWRNDAEAAPAGWSAAVSRRDAGLRLLTWSPPAPPRPECRSPLSGDRAGLQSHGYGKQHAGTQLEVRAEPATEHVRIAFVGRPPAWVRLRSAAWECAWGDSDRRDPSGADPLSEGLRFELGDDGIRIAVRLEAKVGPPRLVPEETVPALVSARL